MLSVVPRPVTVRVPAKVNLHLGVGLPRRDGYHELTTVFQALSLSDTISVVPADALSISVTGESAREVPVDGTNLAWRAAELMARVAGREPAAAISIVKGIPVAGGMAGGSADAAGTLVALARMWHLDIGRDKMRDLAAELGSDVPFSLRGGTALGTGRGEKLTTVLSRGEYHWVLAVAKEGLSTPDVFRELDHLRENYSSADDTGTYTESPDELLQALASGDPRRVADLLHNDMQPAALSMRPALRRTLRAGVDAGALAGIISGSGPTCAFLCTDSDAAVATAAELSGAGVCRAVRTATGPVAGARLIDGSL
ncbi:MAG: 4-(cytidine 5'-diphospho)-2-C-methyl-D-erythritol kinase [Gordonia sp.]|nr:4-(cytidine 5'-diphospho)-2-C-methyl-D-erythritol kinase [Gordonia sp. (in: high G+C Gram-positive bacteria)]